MASRKAGPIGGSFEAWVPFEGFTDYESVASLGVGTGLAKPIRQVEEVAGSSLRAAASHVRILKPIALGEFTMPRLLDVKFCLQGKIREDQDTKSFVSYCPALDLYSAGRTRPEAKAALQSAVDMFIRLSYDRGILGQLLRDKGFDSAVSAGPTLSDGLPLDDNFIAITETHASDAPAYDDVFDVEVPIHLVAKEQIRREHARS